MSSCRSLTVLSRLVTAGVFVVVGAIAVSLLAQLLLRAVLSLESLTYGQMQGYVAA